MRQTFSIFMLTTAVLLVSAAFAQSAALSDGPMQGLERSSERSAERLTRAFDHNKDGRVTQDEMNRTIGSRFVAATHHAAAMTLEQFVAARAAEFRPVNEAMFHRLDWNADGKLTLSEYAAPQHTRFVALDRSGSGAVSCAIAETEYRSNRAGLTSFCRDNDLNMDGKVTRTELDQALGRRFTAGAGGTQGMTLAQFVSSEEARFVSVNARLFRRLDQDGDGLLNVREYGGTELALFAKLDKNTDRVLTPNELRPRVAKAGGSGRLY